MVAALIDLIGTEWVERSATLTAGFKILAIAALAIGGIGAAGVSLGVAALIAVSQLIVSRRADHTAQDT